MADDTNTNEETTDEAIATFVEEAGLVAFEGALIRYLAEIEEETAEEFEKYLEAHSEEDSFLEDLCARFPNFEVLLKEEITELQSDIQEITESVE